jgi:allantoinase
VLAELEAIGRAIAFAAETGCALHVVHVSSGRGVALVAQARARAVDVSCETCPHYLVLDEHDAERLGAVAKCAPPLRGAGERDELWVALRAGDVDLVATDHSPAPAALKEGDDLFAVWGGIAGAQTLLALLYEAGVVARDLAPAALADLLAGAPARRFGLAPAKGALDVGADADVTLLDPTGTWTVAREELLDRHRLSPFVGRRLRGRVVRRGA